MYQDKTLVDEEFNRSGLDPLNIYRYTYIHTSFLSTRKSSKLEEAHEILQRGTTCRSSIVCVDNSSEFSCHDTLRLLGNNLFNLMLRMMAGIVTVADIMTSGKYFDKGVKVLESPHV